MAGEAETTRILLSITDFLEGNAGGIVDVMKSAPHLAALPPQAIAHGFLDLMVPEGRRFIAAPADLRSDYAQLQQVPPFVRVPIFRTDTKDKFVFEIPANSRAFHTVSLEAMLNDRDSVLSHLKEVFEQMRQTNPEVDPDIFNDYYAHWSIDMAGGLVYILPTTAHHDRGSN